MHEENKPISEFKIIKTVKFEIPKEDIITIENDYNAIMNMIKRGEAHNLSEKQQKIFAACTKGQGREKDYKTQPFSEIKAKSRAYSFKTGYMSLYIRRLLKPDNIYSICNNEITKTENLIINTLNIYKGKTFMEIKELLNIEVKGKSKLFNIISYMFKTEGKNINQTKEFLENNYSLKTVVDRINKSNNQDMSFPNIDFTEIYQDDFEDSTWYSYFVERTYFLVLWRELENGDYLLDNFLKWNPNEQVINDAKLLYSKIRLQLLTNKIEVEKINRNGKIIWTDNLPGKKSDNIFFQIRPKGNRQSHIIKLPTGEQIKKKCLFLNKEYIR